MTGWLVLRLWDLNAVIVNIIIEWYYHLVTLSGVSHGNRSILGELEAVFHEVLLLDGIGILFLDGLFVHIEYTIFDNI